MNSWRDLTLLHKIYQSNHSEVYRGICNAKTQPIILKFLNVDYPSTEEITRYKQEYEITRHLNLEGVIKAYRLQSYQRKIVIIFEDFGGDSLEILTANRRFSLEEFLEIAIKITQSLVAIHTANIIHKDINPTNIVFNPRTGILKLIDFGIATEFTRENPTLKNPNILEGTLPYISPEQTGRMNRALDYRTDFYSLGVTFYKLLTTQLPFDSSDPLELVHCHIAKQPIPPCQINPEIPPILSDIVIKLMAKIAEERYQSAWGIKADLETCLTQLRTHQTIPDFPLATQDISDKFQISQKLYGREKEVAILLAGFERVSTKFAPLSPAETLSRQTFSATTAPIEMMLVAGYSGIGKSALVAEMYQPITAKKGYFIAGKFEQLQRNVPYYAVVNAFKEFIKQLLTESQVSLTQWREKILAAVGTNGQLIINVIPEIELIIGQQPALPEVGSTESENRFNLVFQKFIRVFCSKEHPLVIFLDDLQWADAASLKLVKLIMTDAKMQYLFFIGAYRDNEVTPTHPLAIALAELRQQNVIIHPIHLAPLGLLHISQLLAHSLSREISSVQPLAALIARKTDGNPFFINQFLENLYTENLLKFNHAHRHWEWNLQEIEQMEVTDNVVTLLIKKLKRLPSATQETLQLAACVGSEFDLATLATICKKSESETFLTLKSAIQLGLIFPTSDLDENLLIPTYQFQHDRIQQAAYTLIEPEQRKNIHLQMGRLLLEKIDPNFLTENIFKIIDHLNLAIDQISDPKERERIAELNLIAGQKAKAAIAYQAAFKYFQTGITLLTSDSWQTHYQLTLSLYEFAAESAYLCGDFQQLDYLIPAVLSHAKTALDTIKVYQVKIEACMAQRQQLQALKIALKSLEQFGVIFPSQPTPGEIQQAAQLTASNLAGKSSVDLLNLPSLRDAKVLAIIKLLSSVAPAAYQTIPEMFPLIVFKMVSLSVEYGNSNLSPFIYAIYGLILAGGFLDFEAGFKFGQLAINLLEYLDARGIQGRTLHIYYAHLHFWKHSLQHCLPALQKAYSLALEFGDLEFSGYAANQEGVQSYLVGNPLNEVQEKIIHYIHDLQRLKQTNAIHYLQFFLQAIANLRNETIENPSNLTGQFYNEVENLPNLYKSNESTALFYYFFNKLILNYLFESKESLANTNSARSFIESVTALAVVPTFYFYDSLIYLRHYSDKKNLRKNLNHVEENQLKMKHWANFAPMNFLHKWYLVAAEKARILGEFLEAEQFYEKAINSARENQYLQEEALAYELAAQFYLQRGLQGVAQAYMKEAYYTYELWGAKAKVKHLQATYPNLLTQSSKRLSFKDSLPKNFSTTGSHPIEVLDLASVMKAYQAISSEIMLDKLLISLMKILIQNAGAQVGYLILEQHNQWLIEASGNLAEESFLVLNSVPLENSLLSLPSTLINYVIRTEEIIVLNHADREGKFINDPYIQQSQPKSILCMPLRDRGQVVGILYLENHLTPDAFTADRLQILNLLSSQAAISITNARLYNQLEEYTQMLEEKVEQRTAELTEATRKAEAANQAKSTFLANMSHELRSPLNAILGFAELMLNKPSLSAENVENLSIIARSGEHLLTLINQVLDLSKIEAGRITLNESNFDLYQLLDSLEDMLSLKADEKGLYLVCDRTPDVPRYVRTDEMKLRQVLINVLNNALKFTQAGGVSLRVTAQAIPTNQLIEYEALSSTQSSELSELFPANFWLFFEIQDTGPGISSAELKNIFEPFVQTQTGRNAAEGTGLGLPISRKFVELMGGEITVESILTQGTTFRFKIQVRGFDRELIETKQSTNKVLALEPNQPQYRILIADDKQINRQLLVKLLKPLGFELKEAKNGREVLTIWQEWEPHLIWMDLRMPEMDGYEATQQIKATAKGQNTVIIAITASAFEEEHTLSRLAGCDDFMRKPLRTEEILEMLHQHLGVRYLYANSTAGDPPNSREKNPATLNLEALLTLPKNLLINLETAVTMADTAEVEHYIDEIRSHHSELANALETWAFNFDYGAILAMIKQAKFSENAMNDPHEN